MQKLAKKKASAAKKSASPKRQKYTYLFGVKTDGDAKMRNLLGGKGANLAEMARIGLPVIRIIKCPENIWDIWAGCVTLRM